MAPSKKRPATPGPKQAPSAKTADGPASKRPLRRKVNSDMTQSSKQAAVAAKAPAAKKAIDEAAAAVAKQVSPPETQPAQFVAPAQPRPSSSQDALVAAAKPAAEAAANPKPIVEQAIAAISKEARMNVELPQGAAKMARRSVDQAQAAFDKANDLAHSNVQIFDAAAGAFKSNATELQLKAMEIAQVNSNAVFGLLRRLLAARRVSDLFQVQRRFASEQFVTFVRQLNELNAISLKLASDTAKPLQQGVIRSLEELRKAAAS